MGKHTSAQSHYKHTKSHRLVYSSELLKSLWYTLTYKQTCIHSQSFSHCVHSTHTHTHTHTQAHTNTYTHTHIHPHTHTHTHTLTQAHTHTHTHTELTLQSAWLCWRAPSTRP